MVSLPCCETLLLRAEDDVLHVTLHQPETRNAMSVAMVRELDAVLDVVEADESLRAVVLRGSGGHFCAGGEMRDMAAALTADRAALHTVHRPPADGVARAAADDVDRTTGTTAGRDAVPGGLDDPLARVNRRFGAVAERLERLAPTTIAVLEGWVVGGGFGLACVVDVALASRDVRFRLPEVGMGLLPAQIAPFLVRRLGLSHALWLALTGATLSSDDALRVGLVHNVVPPGAEIGVALEELLHRVRHAGPLAAAATKRLLLRVGEVPIGALLDEAAVEFAAVARSSEGREGMSAFVEKRPPAWARELEK